MEDVKVDVTSRTGEGRPTPDKCHRINKCGMMKSPFEKHIYV